MAPVSCILSFVCKSGVPGTKLIQTPESLPVSGMYFFCQYYDLYLDL